jgi:hypothetical protein
MIFSEEDPRPARDQINDRYAHGGGWSPLTPNRWKIVSEEGHIQYPGDPPLPPLFQWNLHEEVLRLYSHGLVMIIAPDGSFEISRMD